MFYMTFFSFLIHFGFGYPKYIPIGSVFDLDDITQKFFHSSIKNINSGRNQIYLNHTSYQVSSDILQASTKVCRLFEKGTVAIFAHVEKITSAYLQNMCDAKEIPFITGQWDYRQERGKSINLYPHTNSLSKVYYTVLKEMGWKSFSIIYEDADSMIRLSMVLKQWESRHFPIKFYRIRKNGDYMYALQQIKKSGDRNVIIDCSFDILQKILYQALQVGLISDKFSLFITSLDFHTIDLDPFQYSGANLTGIRIIQSDRLLEIKELMVDAKVNFGMNNVKKLGTEEALMYDAIQLFLKGFQRLKYATNGNSRKIVCDSTESWEYGISLNNFIKSVEMDGLTGFLTFDTSGFRSVFEVEIFKLDSNGLRKTGRCNSTDDYVEWLMDSSTEIDKNTLSLRNTTFRILIALTEPYGMLKETVFKMSGNDQYEGFAIDIINEISKMLGFNYTFSVQADNVYGSLDPQTGQWNGMLRKIMDNEADLAITDLTITADRETAVDFTMPFMNLGVSILYQKPKAAPPSLMSFLLPFSASVWLNLIGAIVIVSTLFFMVGRMCPAEWNNMYPCIEDPENLENQFTMKNSLWFCLGAIMQQGSEIAPIGNSTRMLAGCWWFFCLIIVSSYTANLTAFLTVTTVDRPIKNAEDLANQNIIKYGAKKGGSTIAFFRDSNSTTYLKMYQYMIDNAKDVLTSDNDEGKKKVLSENYAFLMESSSIEYIQERECNLSQVGGLLDQKGYGIAMRKNASYRNELSGAVLKLQEMGILTSLKNKWWKEKGGGGRCQEDSSGGQAEELGIANVGGVYLVLVVGIALSFLMTAAEFACNMINSTSNEEIHLREKLIYELKFILNFRTSTKPTKNRTS